MKNREKADHWHKWFGILELLKNNHGASISKALTKMEIVAEEKEDPHFYNRVIALRYNVCRMCWLDASDIQKEYEEENNFKS